MLLRASEVVASKSNAGNRNIISRPYYGEKVFIKSVEYTFIEQLINEIKTKLKDKIHFDASPQEMTNSMIIWMNANEGISFPIPQIPSLLGYNAKFDENGEYHIGYKKIPSFDSSYEGNELYESHFLISLDTADKAAGDLALWLLVLVLLIYRLHDGLFYRLQKNWAENF